MILGTVARILGLWRLWLVVAAGAVLALVLFLPPVLVAPYGLADAEKRLAAENALRTTMAAVLGGMAVAAGSIVAALNLAHNRRVLEETQRQNRDTIELQRRGQETERFSNAIEHLGQQEDGKLDVRIGAVYALEQVARDSAELHWPIMEILTAYLREHARWVGPDGSVQEVTAGNQPDPAARTPADIQAIATVIGRRKVSQDPDGRHLDLYGVDMSHVQWAEAQLSQADLRLTRLEGADLSSAQLEGANLTRAHLEGAKLRAAQLNGAILLYAQLKEADLGRAQLEDANLAGAGLERAFLGLSRLKGAFLGGAQLDGALLGGAQLEGANLAGAQLNGAHLGKVARGTGLVGMNLAKSLHFVRTDLEDWSEALSRGAHLKGADLSGAQLKKADLSGAQLEGANLFGAQLEGANLSDAQLEGANLNDAQLEGANLSGAQLKGARFSGVDLTQVSGLKWSSLRLAKIFDGSLVPHSVRHEAEREPSVQPAEN